MKHYSTPEQVVSALRATKSESKRVLLDTAANMIESFRMALDALREQEERYKAVSNADHIRAMSDEELARFLTRNVPDCANYCDDVRCGCKWNCKHGDGLHVIRDWLKQPYKEDA